MYTTKDCFTSFSFLNCYLPFLLITFIFIVLIIYILANINIYKSYKNSGFSFEVYVLLVGNVVIMLILFFLVFEYFLFINIIHFLNLLIAILTIKRFINAYLKVNNFNGKCHFYLFFTLIFVNFALVFVFFVFFIKENATIEEEDDFNLLSLVILSQKVFGLGISVVYLVFGLKIKNFLMKEEENERERRSLKGEKREVRRETKEEKEENSKDNKIIVSPEENNKKTSIKKSILKRRSFINMINSEETNIQLKQQKRMSKDISAMILLINKTSLKSESEADFNFNKDKNEGMTQEERVEMKRNSLILIQSEMNEDQFIKIRR